MEANTQNANMMYEYIMCIALFIYREIYMYNKYHNCICDTFDMCSEVKKWNPSKKSFL